MSVHDLLRENDERFRALAHGFGADDWARPSLCGRWTNHEVLAHLVVGLSASLRSVIAEMLRHRGSFDSANAAMARTLAAVRAPAELLDDYQRLSAGHGGWAATFPRACSSATTSRMNSTWSSHWSGEPEIAPDVLVAVLNTQVAVPNPFVPAFRNSRGLRLRATDTAWSHGERGPVVEGRAAELVSVLGGRPKTLPRLVGDGVAVLESRLSLPTRTAG